MVSVLILLVNLFAQLLTTVHVIGRGSSKWTFVPINDPGKNTSSEISSPAVDPQKGQNKRMEVKRGFQEASQKRSHHSEVNAILFPSPIGNSLFQKILVITSPPTTSDGARRPQHVGYSKVRLGQCANQSTHASTAAYHDHLAPVFYKVPIRPRLDR